MDIMHDVLEGTLVYEVKELIKYLHSSSICSLKHINRKLKSFPYGYAEVAAKPSEITIDHLSASDHKLKQNGMQTCQVTRIGRVSHAFEASLQLTCLLE